jgi:6-phosphogluconolactonase (cycloisomerase 2 family)
LRFTLFNRFLWLIFVAGLLLSGCGDSNNDFVFVAPGQGGAPPAATVTGLQISPSQASIANGTSLQYQVTVTLSDGSSVVRTSDVDFESSAPGVAQIGATGQATGLSPGTATITATLDNLSATASLTVTGAELTELRVVPGDALSAPGTTRQYQALGSFNDGTEQDLTSQVRWSTGGANVTVANQNIGPSRVGQAVVEVDAATGTSVPVTATLGSISGQGTLRIGRFLYLSNAGDDSISTASIDSTGALTFSPQTTPAGDFVTDLAVDPTGRFLYAVQQDDSTVRSFSIGNDGSLTEVGTARSVDSAPRVVVVHPDGSRVYVAGQNSPNINTFEVAADGSLTADTAIVTSAPTLGMDIDPTGRYIFISHPLSSLVQSFDVETGEEVGTPVLASNIPGFGASSVVAEPSGRYVYVANTNLGRVYSFSVESGDLQDLGNSLASGTDTFGLAADPAGRFVYAANGDSDDIGQFLIQANGWLAPILPNPTVGTGPIDIDVDPSGRFFYVANSEANTVTRLQIDVGGDLVNPQTTGVGATPSGVVTTP